MMNGRAPAPVDADGALDFEGDRKPALPAPPKPYPSRVFSTQIEHGGFTFTLSYNNLTLDALEDLVREFQARGYTAVKPAKAGGFGQRPDNRIDPAFDGAGNEICPMHRVALRTYTTKDGRSFKGCPSRGTGVAGEKINDKGYCDLRFK